MSGPVEESESGNVYRLDDLHVNGPNLDLPNTPADIPYQDIEDWLSKELLAINNIASTEPALLEALKTQSNVLLSAAAHASFALPAATPLLRKVMQGPDDYAAVEAAYALVRLGEDDGKETLINSLQRPVGPYLSPILAAGYLAQLGDPSGFTIVRDALASDLLAVRMLACKQLFFFMPFHGHVDSSGSVINVLELFERALNDPDPTVQRQALGQLRWLNSSAARPLLTSYLEQVNDSSLSDLARQILQGLLRA